MKRSKMLSEMTFTYLEFMKKYNLEKSPFPIEMLEDLNNMLLTTIEEAGMRPPNCNFYNEEYGIWDHWEEE